MKFKNSISVLILFSLCNNQIHSMDLIKKSIKNNKRFVICVAIGGLALVATKFINSKNSTPKNVFGEHIDKIKQPFTYNVVLFLIDSGNFGTKDFQNTSEAEQICDNLNDALKLQCVCKQWREMFSVDVIGNLLKNKIGTIKIKEETEGLAIIDYTILHHAFRNGYTNVAKCLIISGYDANAKCKRLDFKWYKGAGLSTHFMKSLKTFTGSNLENYVNRNIKELSEFEILRIQSRNHEFYVKPLFYAVINNHPKTVEKLIHSTTNINEPLNYEFSVHICAYYPRGKKPFLVKRPKARNSFIDITLKLYLNLLDIAKIRQYREIENILEIHGGIHALNYEISQEDRDKLNKLKEEWRNEERKSSLEYV